MKRSPVLPQKLDMLLAFKTIALSSELSGTDKRVAAAILDHFNQRTGQCDPGFERLAGLLKINRRSVIRAVRRLEDLGVIEKELYGGDLNRNSYQPGWATFRQLEITWRSLFEEQSRRRGMAKLSRSECQSRTPDGARSVTQTLRINPSKPSPTNASQLQPGPDAANLRTESEKEGGIRSMRRGSGSVISPRVNVASRQAALTAAERRWTKDLFDLYGGSAAMYSAVVEAVDEPLSNAATAAELERRGAGLEYIVNQTRLKAPLSSVSSPAAVAEEDCKQ